MESFCRRYMANPSMVTGCRKGKDMNFLDQNIEDYTLGSNDEDFIIKYEDYFEYVYPKEEDVPETWYYSVIKDVKKPSAYIKPCIDVYYKIVAVQKLNAYCDGYVNAEEVVYHYIRQRYTIDSIYYRNWATSMSRALGLQEFKLNKTIGVTEGFHLVYKKEGSIGSIEDRRPLGIDLELFELDAEADEDIDYEDE